MACRPNDCKCLRLGEQSRRRSAFSSLTTERFTGQYHEASLSGGEGLSYYGAWWYDARLGRFTTPDSIIPKPANPQDFNRYAYVNNNPLKYVDPTGHCPAPPSGRGPTICIALFIKPAVVQVGPYTVFGDGRTFSPNSQRTASRGYVWINPETGAYQSHMNPSRYVKEPDPVPPSSINKWSVRRYGDGSIVVTYDLVIAGKAEQIAPHINGGMVFRRDNTGNYRASFVRDGYPWAEAYYHDGKGKTQVLFQDPAVASNPYDLFAIEPSRYKWWQWQGWVNSGAREWLRYQNERDPYRSEYPAAVSRISRYYWRSR